MSAPTQEIDERLWDYYLLECRATQTKPDLSDFRVWAEDQDFDLDPQEPSDPDGEVTDVD